MSEAPFPRVRALMAKETAELRAAPGVLVTPLLMLLTAVALPFVIVVGVPAWTGEALGGADDLVELARELAPLVPAVTALTADGAVQAFVLQQFLPLLVLVPVIGAMTLVTTSVVGEKQARSLEPLLATPITTGELLAAKTGVALLVSLALLAAGFAVLLGAAAAFAEPGVAATLLTPRPLALVGALAPAVAAVALVLGVMASSRTARRAYRAAVRRPRRAANHGPLRGSAGRAPVAVHRLDPDCRGAAVAAQSLARRHWRARVRPRTHPHEMDLISGTRMLA